MKCTDESLKIKTKYGRAVLPVSALTNKLKRTMDYNGLLDAALRRVNSKINEMCDNAQIWFFHDELCLKRDYHAQHVRDENGNWKSGYIDPDGYVFYLD